MKSPLNSSEITDLVHTWTAPLLLYARQFCENETTGKDAAEDAVQDAFVQLHRLSYRPDDVVAWLFRAVKNAAISRLRAWFRRRRRERNFVKTNPKWFVSHEENPLDAETVAEQLKQMPVVLREVVVAKIWGDLSFEQIGELTKTSRGTAHRRYQEAITILRQSLGVTEIDME